MHRRPCPSRPGSHPTMTSALALGKAAKGNCTIRIAAQIALAASPTVALAQSDYATPYTVTTLIDFTAGAKSDDGFGINASGIAVDAGGTVYMVTAINSAVKKFGADHYLHTVAGSDVEVGSADGPTGVSRFKNPQGIAIDSDGNLFVADSGNNTIRKITPAGVTSTLAGTAGVVGSADGTGAAAQFNTPTGVAVDASGVLYIADEGNDTIRKISPSGVVTTLAGLAGAKGGTDGTGAGARFDRPAGLTIDSAGNVFVADSTNDLVRKVTPSGAVTTLAGLAGSAGDIDGTGSSARFFFPIGMAADGSGNLFVVENIGLTIRKVSPGGVVTTVAGTLGAYGETDGTGASALFAGLDAIAVDPSGALYAADAGNGAIREATYGGAPQIQAQPSDRLASPGSSVSFTVSASGTAPFTYQWAFDGAAIPGAVGSTYTIASPQASDAGSYSVTVSNVDGSATSAPATLTVNSGGAARLVNISTRAMVGTAGNILIPGFVIAGGGTETLLIRADGPALAQFNVAGYLANPILSVLDSNGRPVAYNENWGTNTNPAQIANVSASVGAFALATGSADCALIVNLPAGAYTVQVTGQNGTTGVALAEVYEVSSRGSRLVNISTRAEVGSGANVVIPGFVITGGTEQLLVRGVGPALGQFNVAGFLALPTLTLFDSNNNVVASNTGWGTDSNFAGIARAASSVGAFALPAESADSAKVVSLPAGSYTVEIAGVGGTTGIALAEIYELP